MQYNSASDNLKPSYTLSASSVNPESFIPPPSTPHHHTYAINQSHDVIIGRPVTAKWLHQTLWMHAHFWELSNLLPVFKLLKKGGTQLSIWIGIRHLAIDVAYPTHLDTSSMDWLTAKIPFGCPEALCLRGICFIREPRPGTLVFSRHPFPTDITGTFSPSLITSLLPG